MTKRRGNGEGSFWWNPERKQYEYRFRYDDRALKVRARTKKECLALADAKAAAVASEATRSADAVRPASANPTVGEYMRLWLEGPLPLTVKRGTVANYEAMVRLNIEPSLGSIQLSALAAADVEAMMARMTKRGLSPNTIRNTRAVLRRCLRMAERDGYVQRNVAALTQPVRVETTSRALTTEQAKLLMSSVAGTEDEALILSMLCLGLRKGEALGLRWQDFNFKAGELSVRRALKQEPDGALYFDTPKSKRSRRMIVLPSQVAAAFKAHRQTQADRRRTFGAGWGLGWPDDMVFTSAAGTPLDPSRASRRVQAAARAAGAEWDGTGRTRRIVAGTGLGVWTPHELRHSAASILFAVGVPLKTISELLGHSSIAVTGDIYSHLERGSKEQAATAMNAALFRSPNGGDAGKARRVVVRNPRVARSAGAPAPLGAFRANRSK